MPSPRTTPVSTPSPSSPQRRRRRNAPAYAVPGLVGGENRTLRDLSPGWSVPLDPADRPVRVVAVEWVSFDTLLWRFDAPVADVLDSVAPALEVVLNGGEGGGGGGWGGPVYAAVYDAPPEVVGGVIAVYDPLTWEPGLSPQWRIESACPELVLAEGRIVVPQTGWVPPSAPVTDETQEPTGRVGRRRAGAGHASPDDSGRDTTKSAAKRRAA